MNRRASDLAALHLAVLLFGFAGLFGKLLTLSPWLIVLGRTLFAAAALALLLALRGQLTLPRRPADLAAFALLGAILAVHWATFFYAIQLSSVAIGLLTVASFPVFVTFLEPLLFRERLRPVDAVTAAGALAGLLLLVPAPDLGDGRTLGVLWGTFSGFCFALLSLLNRRYVGRYPATRVALYQNAVACLLLTLVLGASLAVTAAAGPTAALAAASAVGPTEVALLALLGVLLTALPHTLFIVALRSVKTQLASIVASLEPVYGVLLALWLLGEIPGPNELAGGAVILATVVLATRRRQAATTAAVGTTAPPSG